MLTLVDGTIANGEREPAMASPATLRPHSEIVQGAA
jgi:hypothetical protein